MSNSRPYLDNEEKAPLGPNEGEISLIVILRFLKGAYKTIFIFSALGVLAAITYLIFIPKVFEATVQIAMAQISQANNNININNNNNNNNNNSNLNPFGINIEEPILLMTRLSVPTSFNSQTISACGFEDSLGGASSLIKSIKPSIPKGVNNMLELKIFSNSPDAAKSCAKAVFELIKDSQGQILAPYIQEAKSKLSDDIERLEVAKSMISKADKSGVAMSATYLSSRDEIRFLLDEITSLQNIVSNNLNRSTRLVSPIYVSDKPISPKKQIALLAGLFGGFFLGMLIALARQIITKLKSETQEEI